MLARGDGNGFIAQADQEDRLIPRAVKGQPGAFETLMGAYTSLIYNYILVHVSNKEDVRDILQETMLGAWQGLASYRCTASFKTWVIGIARRKVSDFYRRRYRVRETVDLWEVSDELTGDGEMAHVLDRIMLDHATKPLNARDRELVHLVFILKLPYTEVQTLTGLPVGTIKSRIYAIRGKLTSALEDWRDNDG